MKTDGLKTIGKLNSLGHLIVLALSSFSLVRMSSPGANISLFGFVHIDALSSFFIFVTAVVNFAASLYSINYIAQRIEDGDITTNKGRLYYLLFNLFAASMFLVTLVDNLGMLWVAIEMTTLISAFLVGFYNTKRSVEAAWKYIIICSVGIILALLGTILFSYALHSGTGLKSLNWTDMSRLALQMDRNILKVAFILILVGYGTKAGLAPMHTWLPDAHSQAIAPISAMLSGVLLKTAIYAILRFGIIVNQNHGAAYMNSLLIMFGLISMAVACGFLLVQKDIKRLLAYSSIEHIGIICVGLGIGSTLGITGALLHIFNHATTKSLMFFGAGNVVSAYHKNNINPIRGVLKTMPLTGAILLLGVFALTGSPPFSIFFSEIMIIASAYLNGAHLAMGLLLTFIVVAFGAMIHHFAVILFGNAPADMPEAKEPLNLKLAYLFLLLPICTLGFITLGPLKQAITAAAKIIQGA